MIGFILGRWPRFAIRRKRGRLGRTSRIVSLSGWSFLGHLDIGEHVYIGPQARFFALGGITIGDGSIAGPKLTIYSSNHDFFSTLSIPYSNVTVRKKAVKIGRGCWLGDSVTILPGSELGDHCLVGAGSVVRGSFAAGSILVGNPAQLVDTLSPEKLADKYNALEAGHFLIEGSHG